MCRRCRRRALTLTGWPLWRKCLLGIIPSAVLIFVVLGTMMMGLATPTEAGAMGAVGAIVLAAIHSKDFSTTGRKVLIVGVIAGGIGTIIGIFVTEGLAVQARLRRHLFRGGVDLP